MRYSHKSHCYPNSKDQAFNPDMLIEKDSKMIPCHFNINSHYSFFSARETRILHLSPQYTLRLYLGLSDPIITIFIPFWEEYNDSHEGIPSTAVKSSLNLNSTPPSISEAIIDLMVTGTSCHPSVPNFESSDAANTDAEANNDKSNVFFM